MRTTSKWLFVLVLLAGIAITAAPVAADTWDMTAQFTTAANPNGTWSYGFDNTTMDPPEPYVGYNFTIYDSGSTGGGFDVWKTTFDFNDAGVLNPDKPQVYKNVGAGNPAWESTPQGKLVIKSYWRPLSWNGTGEVKEKPSIVRWTVPATGDYTFAGSFTNLRGAHTAGYAVVLNSGTVIMYNRALSGYAPNNVAPIAFTRHLNAGDVMDFIGRQPYFGWSVDFRNPQVITDLAIKSGLWTVSGVVRDGSSNPLAGALVKNLSGAESITTGTDGTYVLPILGGGTVNIQASKAGYEPSTASVTIDGVTPAAKDFALANGVDISGTVGDNNILVHPPLAGVSVSTTDGLYTATTNSAGFYTVRVTRGTYKVVYYKPNYVGKVITTDASGGSVTQNVLLDQGWDFGFDFTNASNPAGVWGFGYATGSAYTQSPVDSYTRMPNAGHWSAQPYDQLWWGISDPGFNGPSFWKNTLYTPLEGAMAYYGLQAYREPRKVLANPSSKIDRSCVARFTAPTSGYYRVTAKFTAASPYVVYPGPNYFNGTNAKVGLMYNGGYLLPMSPLTGFAGRSVNGYTDSQSTGTTVYEFSQAMDISLGDKIDAIVYNDVAYPDYGGYGYNGPGWTQVDVTVNKETTQVVGRVTSAFAGNPPVAGASVIANGRSDPWPTYQTLTDANGYYLLSVRPGTYDLEVRASGYNTSPAGIFAPVDPGVTVTRDFQLTHTGTWSLTNDFSTISNPFGQWAYGYYDDVLHGAQGNPTFNFVPVGTNTDTYPLYGMKGWVGLTPQYNYVGNWLGWLAKNGTGSPVSWTDGYSTPLIGYVEPNHLSFGGGDNYNDAPTIRWTSPISGIMKIAFTVASQVPTPPSGANATISLFKNGAAMATKTIQGFVGSAAASYTDSIGPGPVATFETQLAINSGDTIDWVLGHVGDIYVHWWPDFGWPSRSLDIWATISPGSGTAVTTVKDLKALAQGTTVFVTVPVQLCSGTVGALSFDKMYGNPALGNEYSFYVQNTDRTDGVKCITDGTVPTYDPTYKITFTGVIDVQMGQKVVRINSINSAVAGTAPKPMGKGSKSLTANSTLVKVWGKIVSITNNPSRALDTWADGATPPNTWYKWDYEYMVINDGGQDVKIPLHTQASYMSGYDGGISGLTVGDYVAVTGVSGTTNGTDAVVYPRNAYDIVNYTDLAH